MRGIAWFLVLWFGYQLLVGAQLILAALRDRRRTHNIEMLERIYGLPAQRSADRTATARSAP